MSALFPKKSPSTEGLQTVWAEWVEKIQHEGVNLSTWEEDFIESVGDQVALGRPLSDKQGEIIERIYTERVP